MCVLYTMCVSSTCAEHILFRDPLTGLRAQWVQRVDMAPMALRRIAFLNVGGCGHALRMLYWHCCPSVLLTCKS